MDSKVQIFFIISIVLFFIMIIHLLKKKKLNLKYTLLWIISIVVLLIVTLFPDTILFVSKLVGIKTPINSALVLASMLIVMILIMLTSIVSQLNRDLRIVTQEIALLEKKVREMSEDKQGSENSEYNK